MFDADFEEIPTNCKDCDYCTGFSWDDGTPHCGYDGEYENCPYCEQGEIRMSNEETQSQEVSISINTAEMESRIIIAFRNTIQKTVEDEVSRIVRGEFEQQIQAQTREILSQKIQNCVNDLFAQPVTIGGGWREEAQTITREQYLLNEIGKQLESGFSKEKYDERILNEAKKHIENFASKTRQEVNLSVKNIFDAAMQQNLTNSIVNVLMQNETYQKLSASAQNMIEAKK